MDYAELKILIETETAEIGAFLVDFELNMENQIKLHADLLEGHISVDQLKYLSRSIENALGDESEDYSIEVSSPGMFTPFKVPEQYKKSIGRLVKVNILESGDSLKGTLKSYDGKEIELHWTERVPKPKGKGKMDVEYMLETMEKSRTELNELGYDLLLAPNVLYDYRAIFMKIYGRDTKGNHVCPKTPKTPLGEDYGSTTFSRETVSSQVES